MKKTPALFLFSIVSFSLHANYSYAGEEEVPASLSEASGGISVPSTSSSNVENAGSHALSSFTDLNPADLDAIAARLSALARSDVLTAVAGQVNSDSEEGGLDVQFVKRALSTLGELLSAPDSRNLLADGGKDPEAALRALLQSQGQGEGEEDEALIAIILYFISLKRVLEENAFLRTQVGELIQSNAEKLLTEGDFTKVLSSIANSNVFLDLKEEVEERMQRTTGYVPVPETGGDMS